MMPTDADMQAAHDRVVDSCNMLGLIIDWESETPRIWSMRYHPSWCLLDEAVESEVYAPWSIEWADGIRCDWHAAPVDQLRVMLGSHGFTVADDGTVTPPSGYGALIKANAGAPATFTDLLILWTDRPALVADMIAGRV